MAFAHSNLKLGTLTSGFPAYSDPDQGKYSDPAYLCAGADGGLNDIITELIAAQQFAVNMAGHYANVRDYGAKGDGTTDDTVAIQAACDNSDGRNIIFLPPGLYKTTSTVTVPTYRMLWGIGSRAHFLVDTGADLAKSATNIINLVSNPVIRLDDAKGMYGIQVWGAASATQVLVLVQDVGGQYQSDGIIENCWFGRGGIHLKAVKWQGWSIRGSVFDWSGDVLVLSQGGQNNQFTGCRFFAGENAGLVLDTNEIGAVVANNVFDYIASGFIGVPIGSTPTEAAIRCVLARNLTVIGNQFNRNWAAIAVAGDSYDIAVVGNTFSSMRSTNVYVDAAKRIGIGNNVFCPLDFPSLGAGMGQPGDVLETATCGHIKTVNTCSRIAVTNNNMVGNVNRTVGVEFSAGTTLSLVDNLIHEGLTTPVSDLNGTNTVGRVIG